MEVTLTLDNATVYAVRRFRVLLGEKFRLDVTPAQGRFRWFADNDEVLAIDDNGGPTANIEATAVGKSTLNIQSAVFTMLPLQIEVYEEPTVTVEQSFGNLRDRQE